MMRPSVIAVSMSMLAACGGLAYLHAKREQTSEEAANAGELRHSAQVAGSSASAPASDAAVASTDGASTEHAAEVSSDTGGTSATENAAAPETIAQLIKDTDSPDAKTRAAAIAALANSPEAVAMPVLKRVLETGEPIVDRNVALRSMYAIALRDGDRTGEVRNAMRHAIYHGDDDGVTQNAQSLLDDIEAEFAQREQDAKSASKRQ